MQCDIRIRSPTYPIGTELVVTHDSEETILTLKTKIKDGLQNPALLESVQKLIYAGHVLEDNKTLKQHNIPNNATFHLVTPPNITPIDAPTRQPTVEETPDDASTPSVNMASRLSEQIEYNQTVPHIAASSDIATNRSSGSTPGSAGDPATEALQSSTRTASVSFEAAESSPNENERDRSIDLQGLAASAHQFLAQQGEVQRTSLRYELCYIDGFPYLVKSTDRRSRAARRIRSSSTMRTPSQHGEPVAASSNIVQPPSNASAIRQHHVDLPATAAIPVRTAEGRRALILSPEGVRVMAAQGVNVETAATNRAVFGINAVAIRNFMSVNMPHAWLGLKLAFIVGMLSTNSTWTRFLILNVVALVIFLWQSGILNRAALGRSPGTAPPGDANVRADVPHTEGIAQAAAVASNGVDPGRSATHNDTTQRSESGARSRRSHDSAAPMDRSWFQSFSNAFLSSIMPGASNQDTRLLRAPANGMAHAEAHATMPDRNETPATRPLLDEVESPRVAQPVSSVAEESSVHAGSFEAGSSSAQSVENTSRASSDRDTSEHERADTDLLQENMSRDW